MTRHSEVGKENEGGLWQKKLVLKGIAKRCGFHSTLSEMQRYSGRRKRESGSLPLERIDGKELTFGW